MATRQIKTTIFNPYLYWATIITAATLGDTLYHLIGLSLHIGNALETTILIALLTGTLLLWKWDMDQFSINSITNPIAECYYWVAIILSQTAGCALADWMTGTKGIGYGGSGIIFSSLLLIIFLGHRLKLVNQSIALWSAFVLIRPLGAVLGEFLDKPIAKGGLALSRHSAFITLLVMIIALLIFTKPRPARSAH